ncbi:ABC transporter permease [Mesorhizobium hawassense]|uniref:ABC transporter permease n=1 Tax=Mesorhizobium hawassense TaxID=1209954 RepID=A0A330HKT0_9HYPH|nr:ABC transporter permease [Mesorhizobium hawassense]RAZ89005.1 ABC transporter permease [Mesorhizobium hawassense]
MVRFLARRLLHFVLTITAASFLLFAVTEFSPGDVASKILGPYAVDTQVEMLRQRLKLNDPLPIRYIRWIGTLLGIVENPLGDSSTGLGLVDPRGNRYFGNLGYSLMLKEPVIDVLSDRLGYTLLLAFWAVVFIVPLSITMGVVAGMNEGRLIDRLISMTAVVLTSLPEFVVSVGLLLVGVAWLGILPGTSPMNLGSKWSIGTQLFLPVTVLVIASASYVSRIVRASVVDTLRRPYVRTALLKGLPRWQITIHHVLRNAMIPPITVILLQINWLLTGVVVVEAIFAYPGVGSLLLQAGLYGDIYLVQALSLLALSVAVGTQLIGDLCYMALDPKIKVA